ncbi:MAG: response regulator [Streptosporangiaceae bacterium]|nr:response regulator [Streptosporangiaceae bacterium]
MTSGEHGAVILLAGHAPGDAVLIREAFEQAVPAARVFTVNRAEQAAGFARLPAFPGGRRPDLILLGLGLPPGGGLDVLDDLKGDPEFSAIPVVVLSPSHDPHVEQRCYALHVNAYIGKPAGDDGLAAVIDQIITWFLGVIATAGSS